MPHTVPHTLLLYHLIIGNYLLALITALAHALIAVVAQPTHEVVGPPPDGGGFLVAFLAPLECILLLHLSVIVIVYNFSI